MQIKRTKDEPGKQDTIRRRASLAVRTSSARAGPPPEEGAQDVPAGLAETHEGKTTSPNYSTTTHVVDRCSVKPQSD